MSASTPAAEPPVADEPLLKSRHTPLLMAALMAVSIIQILDLTISNVALPHMQTSLGASPETISWTLTSFIIAGVLFLPVTGWLADRVGSRNLFLWATAAFVGASMLCGAATSLNQMIAFRAIQGIAAAFIGPLGQTLLFDINRPSQQARAMAIWGVVIMIAPISGPFVGGFLTEQLNWRWVFYVNLPIGIPALAILWWLLPSRPIVRRRLDLFGAVMLGAALVSLQLMLDRGQGKDWLQSTEIVVELLICLSALWIFAVHTRSVAHPLFAGKLLRNPNFLGGLAFMTLLGVTNVALSAVMPTMFQSIYGYDVMDTGLLMAPRGCGILVTMLLVGRFMDRIDNRLLITLGFGIVALSLWMMTGWSLEMGSDLIVLSAFVQGLGLGFVFVPINMIAFASLDPAYRTDGTTLMTLLRNLGGSFGISAIVTMLSRNMQTSHADVAASVTSFNLPAIDPAAAAAQFGELGAAAMTVLNGEVTRQAAMVAYLDNFYMMFWMVLAFAPLAWVLKRPQPVAAGAARIHE